MLREVLDLFLDEEIVEVFFNGFHQCSVWKFAKSMSCVDGHSFFQSEEQMTRELQDLAFAQGLRLDPFHPSCGGMLQGQGNLYRWHAVLKPLAPQGPLLSLRRARMQVIDLDAFRFRNSFDKDVLIRSIEEGCSLLVAGATGSGKSTFMNALLREFCCEERVGILEQLEELPLASALWFRLVAQQKNVSGHGEIKLADGFRDILRLRPDRVVVGELRGDEARVFFDAVICGHGSCFSTIHAGTPEQALQRFYSLCLESGVGFEHSMWKIFQETVDLCVVQMKRGKAAPVVECVRRFNASPKGFALVA